MNAAPHTLVGRLVETGQVVRLTLAGGRIAAVEPTATGDDAAVPWLGPGLVDMQVNGYAGRDFNAPSLSAATVAEAVRILWGEGVTTFLPTIITNTEAAITGNLRAVAAARAADPRVAATAIGVHLEGPFISAEDGARGAHVPAAVRPPDWSLFTNWQEAAGGAIRLVTLAPEWSEAPAFIARCVACGVEVALGHTQADGVQIGAATAAGARLVTHFGNGIAPLLPRHPNPLWEQLARDELWVSLIGDGFHLPPSVLAVAMHVKGERAFLVSDTVALAGLPPGEYDTPVGGRVCVTADGRLVLASDPRLLAGSVCPLPGAVAALVRNGLATLAEAWAMASVRPARFLGLPIAAGLTAGAPADVAVFAWDGTRVTLLRVYKGGVPVYERGDGRDA